jgi:glutathione S-transferase
VTAKGNQSQLTVKQTTEEIFVRGRPPKGLTMMDPYNKPKAIMMVGITILIIVFLTLLQSLVLLLPVGVFVSALSTGTATRNKNRDVKWKCIEDELQISSRHYQTPSCIDSVLDPSTPTFSTHHPTLFRERHGWCPYSERVWLTCELLGIDYDTVRIDNTGAPRPSYYRGGQTPQMRWPDSKQQGESMDIVKELDNRYNSGSKLYTTDPDVVQECIDSFRTIFPSSRARPSSRAAFLFQYNGEPLGRHTFETTLQQTDQLLSSGNGDGPFFCGRSEISAADIAWAPFLERYRYQLPCLHDGLEPDDSTKYPHLAAWYDAMDCVAINNTSSHTIANANLAVYPCRVKGDASSWRKVLSMAGFGNAGIPPTIQMNMEERRRSIEVEQARNSIRFDVWQSYYQLRTLYVANTPHAEAASILVTNRHGLINDIMKQQTRLKSTNTNYVPYLKALPTSYDELDDLLLQLAQLLVDTGSENLVEPAAGVDPKTDLTCLAAFLDVSLVV